MAAWGCDTNRPPTSPIARPAAQITPAPDSQQFYSYFTQRIYVTPDPTRLVVATTEALPTVDAVRQAVAAGGLTITSLRQVGPAREWLLELPASTPLTSAVTMRRTLLADPRFSYVQHGYKTAAGASVLFLDHVIARFKSGVTDAQVAQLAASLGSHVVRPPVPDSGYKNYILSADSASDVLRVANAINVNSLAQWAAPEMVGAEKPMSVPSDPYFPLQYYLHNTITYNGIPADIDIEPAWDLTKGSSSIKIIFIGTGVDRWHPEFADRASSFTGFDAVYYLVHPPYTDWAGQPAPDDGHGTSVAGIAIASHDGSGIAGIAPNVLFDAARIFRRDPVADTEAVATSNGIANAITWAYQRADVINNSWGDCGSPDATITAAVQDALTQGRGGKGTVVVFSAGNAGGGGCTTTQTWESSISGVIGVQALARTGALVSYALSGNSIAVSAFGGELSGLCWDGNLDAGADIVTTDLNFHHDCENGPNGTYNYTTDFSGTSAAAPQVSGVAALLLSREPNLTAAQVKSRIMASADPWGVSTSFGAGKLNAYRTLANLQTGISGPTYIQSAGRYTWTATPSGGVGGYSYQWQESTNGTTWYPVGTNSQTYSEYEGASGSFYLRVTVSSGGLQASDEIGITVDLGGGCSPKGC